MLESGVEENNKKFRTDVENEKFWGIYKCKMKDNPNKFILLRL